MFLLVSGRHVGAHPPGWATTWRLNTNLYKFGWNTSANSARIRNPHRPDSWRGCLYCNHLSYPRFLNLFIERLRFLVFITWQMKTENKLVKNCNKIKLEVLESKTLSNWLLLLFSLKIKVWQDLLNSTKPSKALSASCCKCILSIKRKAFSAFTLHCYLILNDGQHSSSFTLSDQHVSSIFFYLLFFIFV